ncbi:hypothetical protein LEN26_017868 [Aphanomyces euteiches]|nr:hypothetical protein LEN26_017868 [Aphanomyces euteiches]
MSLRRVLPSEILTKIAFYLNDWTTVTCLVKALLPANLTGTLKHLWILHSMGWSSECLWPSLYLTHFDHASQAHVEVIAKYYSRIVVHCDLDPTWARHHVNPNASVEWTWSSGKTVDSMVLSKWTQIRITSCDLRNFPADTFCQALSYLDHLVVLKWNQCTPANTTAIFEFAASSSALKTMELLTNCTICPITPAMATNLVQWIASQPVRLLHLVNFTMGGESVRLAILSALIKSSTVQEFKVREVDEYSALVMSVGFSHDSQPMYLGLCDYQQRQRSLVDCGRMCRIICLLTPLFQKTKRLILSLLPEKHFAIIWNYLTQQLQQSSLEALEMDGTLSDSDIVQIADQLWNLPALQELSLYHAKVSFEGAKHILNTAPASTKAIHFARDLEELQNRFHLWKWQRLQEISLERSIHIVKSKSTSIKTID